MFLQKLFACVLGLVVEAPGVEHVHAQPWGEQRVESAVVTVLIPLHGARSDKEMARERASGSPTGIGGLESFTTACEEHPAKVPWGTERGFRVRCGRRRSGLEGVF